RRREGTQSPLSDTSGEKTTCFGRYKRPGKDSVDAFPRLLASMDRTTPLRLRLLCAARRLGVGPRSDARLPRQSRATCPPTRPRHVRQSGPATPLALAGARPLGAAVDLCAPAAPLPAGLLGASGGHAPHGRHRPGRRVASLAD